MPEPAFAPGNSSVTFAQQRAFHGFPAPRFVAEGESGGLLAEASVRQRLDKVMRELRALPEGWDGHGASALGDLTVHNAQRIVLTLAAHTQFPQIIPGSGDTVTFEWESAAGEALIEIGRRTYSFLMTAAGGKRTTDTGSVADVAGIAALGMLVQRALFDAVVA